MSATQPVAVPDNAGEGLRLVMPGRHCAAGAGWDWVVRGWRLFTRAPLMWIIALLILFLLGFVMSLVPLVGSLVYNALSAVLAAGLVVACRSLEKGGEFDLEHLFAGFRSSRFTSLLVVGVIFTLGGLAILLVFVAIVGITVLGSFVGTSVWDVMNVLAGSALMILLGLAVCLALWAPLLAAFWFAPALVMLHGVEPLPAMKASFAACLRNFAALLVYGLVGLGALVALVVVAIVPILGWIASFAGFVAMFVVTITSTYAAYRDIFTEDETPQAPPRAAMV